MGLPRHWDSPLSLSDLSHIRPYNYPLPYRLKPPLLAPIRCNEVGERRYAPRRLDCPSTQRFPPNANFKPNNATIQSEQYKTLTRCLSTIPSDSHIATSLKSTISNVLHSPRRAPTDFFPSFQPHWLFPAHRLSPPLASVRIISPFACLSTTWQRCCAWDRHDYCRQLPSDTHGVTRDTLGMVHPHSPNAAPSSWCFRCIATREPHHCLKPARCIPLGSNFGWLTDKSLMSFSFPTSSLRIHILLPLHVF